jgi:cytoskeletal protein RodZ
MSGFGDALRHARANKGVTLTEAERAIRIPRKYLRALEDEDFLSLPEGVYSRGIVRNYAQYLNLDPDDAIAYFEDLRGGVSSGFKVVPAVKPLEMPSHWAPNFALIAFVVVISAVLFAWLYSAFFAATNPAAVPTPSAGIPTPTVVDVNAAIRALTPTSTMTPAPTETPAPPTAVPPTATQAPAPPSQSSQQAAPPQQVVATQPPAASRPSTAPPTPTPDSGDLHVVTIQAQEEAWVTVTIDGVVEYAGVLEAGDTLNYEGQTIEVYSSNAANVYLWADGADYGLISETNWEGTATIP